MRVIVYGRPGNPNSEAIRAAFAGVEAAGHRALWRNPGPFTPAQIEACELVVVNGLAGPCASVRDAYQGAGVPVLVVDWGYFRRGEYFQLGIDDLNWMPPQECPGDRWERLGLRLAGWRERKEGHILVCGQKDSDAQHRINPDMWAQEAIAKLRGFTDREIVWRPHPRGKISSGNGADRMSAGGPLEEDLRGCHALVTFNSNAGREALVAGVPVFCDRSAAYAEIANTELAEIESPVLRDRAAHFNRLAYAQWTLEELASGEALSFVIQFVGGGNGS